MLSCCTPTGTMNFAPFNGSLASFPVTFAKVMVRVFVTMGGNEMTPPLGVRWPPLDRMGW